MIIENFEIEQQLLQKQAIVKENDIKCLSNILTQTFQYPENYFILQIGDCAEPFKDSAIDIVEKKCDFYLQMANMLEVYLQKEVILIGRIAGQYAKPRTDSLETQKGQTLPVYRGDMINEFEFTTKSRQIDSNRILEAYTHAKSVVTHIDSYIFRKNIEKKIFTSHEALVLEYDRGLTRTSQTSLKKFNYSAHTIWLGNRSRDLNGPQIEYLSSVHNPIGIKIGPTEPNQDFLDLLERLNPNRIEGKIYLMTRLGANLVHIYLPKIIKAVKQLKMPVLWCVDPMHGNTFKIKNGLKVRSILDILDECKITAYIHKKMGTCLSGVHLEASYEHVSECINTSKSHAELEKYDYYTSMCDPRLNPDQVKRVLKTFKAGPILKPNIQNNITKELLI